MSGFAAGPGDILLIRHGESDVNIDMRVASYAAAPLTARGREQAKALAASWPDRPRITASSPFRRAQDTAEILRVPGQRRAPLESRLAEFSFLDPAFAALTTWRERRERVRDFWDRCDPEYRDGGAGESFEAFAARVRSVMRSLARPGAASPRLCVTHGVVIALAQADASYPGAGLPELMGRVRDTVLGPGVVAHCAVVAIRGAIVADAQGGGTP